MAVRHGERGCSSAAPPTAPGLRVQFGSCFVRTLGLRDHKAMISNLKLHLAPQFPDRLIPNQEVDAKLCVHHIDFYKFSLGDAIVKGLAVRAA